MGDAHVAMTPHETENALTGIDRSSLTQGGHCPDQVPTPPVFGLVDVITVCPLLPVHR